MQLWPVALEEFVKKKKKKKKLLSLSLALTLGLSIKGIGVFSECIIAYDCVSWFYDHHNVLNG